LPAPEGSLRADISALSIVVTGGTKGIGRATVKQLVNCGAKVAFQGRDIEAAATLIDECSTSAGEAHFVPGDVGAYEDAQKLVEFATSRFGRLDVYVSSGGPTQPSPKLFTDLACPKDSIAMIESRLRPRLNGLHAAVPVMRSQGFGKIVLLTTDAARIPTPSESMVGAAGASIMFLTRALAKELAGYGIRINAIATTLTTGTPAYERYVGKDSQKSEEVIAKAFFKVHSKVKFRVNTPEDVANYILYLASPASDQISGSTLSINGGLSFPSY
jgi:2-hydroxycyclohexanecarboxyl-CoA dehydrogenase